MSAGRSVTHPAGFHPDFGVHDAPIRGFTMDRNAHQQYGNGRFGFSVDYPALFNAEPAPTNGDGQEWKWGKRATMTASGMYSPDEAAGQPFCPDYLAKKKGLLSKTFTKTSCWITGKDAGKIFWEKYELSKGTNYSLRFEYDDDLKEYFDPIVAHVNTSWKYAQ
jgi:hypothetical protein